MTGRTDNEKEEYDRIYRSSVRKWNNIAKPIGSLGLLEKYVAKLCAVSGSDAPPDISRRALVVMCADNGVVVEGVTQTGSGVTRIVAENFANGKSSVNYMAECAGADVYTVDIGMDTDRYAEKKLITGAVIDRKISRGTGNIAKGPAMTEAECKRAIETGIDIVGGLKNMGYKIIATGEMGIGNTTPTSVLGAYLLDLSVGEATGRGAGLDDDAFAKKKTVVDGVLKRLRAAGSYKPDTDMTGIMAEAGSFEIAGMTGIFLGGVKHGVPIIADGVISVIAALAASQIDKRVCDYMLASHVSEEKLAGAALAKMNSEAVIHGHMCLGEGSGAVSLLPLLDMGISVYKNMGTFADLHIKAYNNNIYGSL